MHKQNNFKKPGTLTAFAAHAWFKMGFLIGCRAGQVWFKDCLTVNSDIQCFYLNIQTRKRKRRIWRIEGISEITENY